jgi:hypothetical protein
MGEGVNIRLSGGSLQAAVTGKDGKVLPRPKRPARRAVPAEQQALWA